MSFKGGTLTPRPARRYNKPKLKKLLKSNSYTLHKKRPQPNTLILFDINNEHNIDMTTMDINKKINKKMTKTNDINIDDIDISHFKLASKLSSLKQELNEIKNIDINKHLNDEISLTENHIYKDSVYKSKKLDRIKMDMSITNFIDIDVELDINDECNGNSNNDEYFEILSPKLKTTLSKTKHLRSYNSIVNEVTNKLM